MTVVEVATVVGAAAVGDSSRASKQLSFTSSTLTQFAHLVSHEGKNSGKYSVFGTATLHSSMAGKQA